jgi:hypothetical protein
MNLATVYERQPVRSNLSPVKEPAARHFRWVILGVTFCATTINYMDRFCFGRSQRNRLQQHIMQLQTFANQCQFRSRIDGNSHSVRCCQALKMRFDSKKLIRMINDKLTLKSADFFNKSALALVKTPVELSCFLASMESRI